MIVGVDVLLAPPSFVQDLKDIFKYIWRVYLHIYHAHMKGKNDNTLAAVNTSLERFYYFIVEFHMLDTGETAPLQPFINAIIAAKHL